MSVLRTLAVAIVVALLVAGSLPARADPRAVLETCQATLDRAAQIARTAGSTADKPDEAELQRCRQVVRDWTLRESRMSVDEHGRPLR
jgi:hypothetical protein